MPLAPVAIKAARSSLGLSAKEFDAALGYRTDGRITLALEAGERNGKPFELMGSAQTALERLLAIKDAYEKLGKEDWFTAQEILRQTLPEGLR